MERNDFKKGFDRVLVSNLNLFWIWTKTDAFYKRYKSKIAHQYKKMHGNMNATNIYIESKLI
jgi:hypothetical protein